MRVTLRRRRLGHTTCRVSTRNVINWYRDSDSSDGYLVVPVASNYNRFTFTSNILTCSVKHTLGEVGEIVESGQIVLVR
jgi:hypothetical protein